MTNEIPYHFTFQILHYFRTTLHKKLQQAINLLNRFRDTIRPSINDERNIIPFHLSNIISKQLKKINLLDERETLL